MPTSSTAHTRHDRCEIASLLEECDTATARGQSERAFCREAGIARSTLRDAAEREVFIDAPDLTVAFFTSPEGHLFLRRIVLAAHFAMTLLGPCGVALVCTFLRLSGLSPFVACSYGAQQRLNTRLLEQVAAFGQAEQARLGTAMPSKKVWLCEDETFFPRILLLALDALSGFIFVEHFAERRDAATWTAQVSTALKGLRVEVIGFTSDLAKGLVAHAKNAFCLNVTPDLFHAQYEVTGGCCAALGSQTRALEEALKVAQEKGADKLGREEATVAVLLAEARERQSRMSAALEAMSDATHPFDVQTGQYRSSKQVEAELHEMLDEAEAVADEAELSEASHEAIGKTRRAVAAMAESIDGFHARLNAALGEMRLPVRQECAMRQRVLPALYLRAVAERSGDSEKSRELEARAQALVAPLQEDEDSPMLELSEAAVAYLETQGREWVSWYVRASSCAEGRNGQLSLRHHSLHTLGDKKLPALTAVHNFWSQRDDGTTAAERFFEQKPLDLFAWLLDIMPDLPYPAQNRPRVAPSPLLN